MRPSLPIVVRGIALVEAAKGALALLTGLGLLSLDATNAAQVAGDVVRFCHLDPAGRYPRVLLEAAGGVTAFDLGMLAFMALAYAAIRALEAYWLWNARPWAEWFALGSTCFYLPVELYELAQHVTALLLGVLFVNLAIVAYLANALRQRAGWRFSWGRKFVPARPPLSSSHPA